MYWHVQLILLALIVFIAVTNRTTEQIVLCKPLKKLCTNELCENMKTIKEKCCNCSNTWCNGCLNKGIVKTEKDCKDEQGVIYQANSSWAEKQNPCYIYMCDNGRIDRQHKQCPPPPNPLCVTVAPTSSTVSGERCCPEYRCDKCVDTHGALFTNDSAWTLAGDPCTTKLCIDGAIRTTTITCNNRSDPANCGCYKNMPCPLQTKLGAETLKCNRSVSCKAIHQAGVCCPSYKCEPSECVDENGVQRTHKEYWNHPNRLCKKYFCNNGNIATIFIPCNKSKVCISENNSTKYDGEEWIDSHTSCKINICNKGVTKTTTIENCDKNKCIDEHGNVFRNNNVWKHPQNPCDLLACKQGRIENIRRKCPTVPVNCSVYRKFPNECCPIYECNDYKCDKANTTHHNFKWIEPNRPCIVKQCSKHGEIEKRTGCELKPGCIAIARPNKCCPEFKCTKNCVDKNHIERLDGAVWLDRNKCEINTCDKGTINKSNITCIQAPTGCQISDNTHCCPTYKCQSKCIDYKGKQRENMEQWKYAETSCSLETCFNGVIASTYVECGRIPANCDYYHSLSQCCPVIKCQNITNCMDGYGNYRIHNEKWIDKMNDCLQYTCDNGMVNKKLNCETSKPKCSAKIPDKCCPAEVCQGNCVDAENKTRNHGEHWVSQRGPCRNYTCYNRRIREETVQCKPVPNNCISVSSPKHCCPVQLCSKKPDCLDKDGRHRKHGERWTNSTDDSKQQCQMSYKCDNGTITTETVGCEVSSVTKKCQWNETVTKCCPNDRCADCEYNNITYKNGKIYGIYGINELRQCQVKMCRNGHMVSLGVPIICDQVDNCANHTLPVDKCCPKCTGDIRIQIQKIMHQIKSHCTYLLANLNTEEDTQNSVRILIDNTFRHLEFAVRNETKKNEHIQLFVHTCLQTLQKLRVLSTTLLKITPLPVQLNEFDKQIPKISDNLKAMFRLEERETNQLQLNMYKLASHLRHINIEETLNSLNKILDNIVAKHKQILRADEENFNNRVTTNISEILHKLEQYTHMYVNLLQWSEKSMEKKDEILSDFINEIKSVTRDNKIPNNKNAKIAMESFANLIHVIMNKSSGYDVNENKSANELKLQLEHQINEFIIKYSTTLRLNKGHKAVIKQKLEKLFKWIELNMTSNMNIEEIFVRIFQDIFDIIITLQTAYSTQPENCFYDGIEKDHGTTWPKIPIRPCILLRCDNGVIKITNVSETCDPAPANRTCMALQLPYQCCANYDCVTVKCKYKEQVYRLDKQWYDSTEFPCKQYRCTLTGVIKVQDNSTQCKRQPAPLCTSHRVWGRCCPEWNCSMQSRSLKHCMYKNETRKNNEMWWNSNVRRCTQYRCVGGKVVQVQNLLPCQPVPPNCRPMYSGRACCHYTQTCNRTHKQPAIWPQVAIIYST